MKRNLGQEMVQQDDTISRLIKKKGEKKKNGRLMGAWKKRPSKKNGLAQKKKKNGRLMGANQKNWKSSSVSSKISKKVWKKCKKRSKPPFKKKWAHQKKKKMGGKMGAKKSAHFFLMGALKKKKEGQRPFFWDRFLGALLNKPNDIQFIMMHVQVSYPSIQP